MKGRQAETGSEGQLTIRRRETIEDGYGVTLKTVAAYGLILLIVIVALWLVARFLIPVVAL
jgi:hypothetical protein